MSYPGFTLLPTMSVRVRVPAKINLALEVGALREDGYHDLSTVFHAVDLTDEVTVRPASAWSVSAPGTRGLTTGPDNLALRAARLLHARLVDKDGGTGPGPVALELAKSIPVAGGMAGGSADAAGALVACNTLWQADFDAHELADMAAELGADVPFALAGGTALGSGRGDQISPVLTRMTLHWVIATAQQGLSTPEVFAELDRLRAAGRAAATKSIDAVMTALRSADLQNVAGVLANDLQPAAYSLRPELRRTVRSGIRAGALAAIVSGSGPTVAMLCQDADHAQEVAVAVSAEGIAGGVRTASGPVRGAHVVHR